MRVDLLSFQQKALGQLRLRLNSAISSYRADFIPQILSFTAPTGAGKTIIMAALVESVFNGDELFIHAQGKTAVFPEMPDSVFLWLSDSPELNEQSKAKFDLKADRLRLGQCIILDDSFKGERLEDGHIYFLNTQKLGVNSNLTKHSDNRQHTIWEVLQNTVSEKRERLIVIIDEFTVLYNCIKKGVASEDLLHNWKAIQESDQTNFATIFIGHDITPTFFAEPYATNAAAIIERYPVSYLDTESAKELIERPILADGKTRFDAKAVERILYYTAGSPWYLQIFMQEMVKYINDTEVITVTDIDVYNVAQRFITKQVESLSKTEDFSSLINSGLDNRFTVIKDAQFVSVLRGIAKGSEGLEWCDYAWLQKMPGLALEAPLDVILKDLEDRKVIERKDNNQLIKIKVGLFKEWLIRN